MQNHPGGTASSDKQDNLIKIAVFDFDSTSIDGNSPVLLVRYLIAKKMISKSVLVRIALWATAYKLRLPQNESWVRGLVFTAFKGMQKNEVDLFLREFYENEIEKRFREQADSAMHKHHDNGEVVLVVSATFEPIVKHAMDYHPIQGQISTRMRVDESGAYTCQVEGLPIEGEEKLNAVRRLADGLYGTGKWELTYAYGDHHSDRVLLQAAVHAFAVDPDNPLKRTAQRNGWQVLDWD